MAGLGRTANGCCGTRGDGARVGLGCAATCDYLFVLDNDTDNAECVVDGALEPVDYVLGAALDDDGDCLRVLALFDEGHLFATDLALFNETGLAEFVLVIASIEDHLSKLSSSSPFHI